MKKLILILVVLAMAAPCIAAGTITFGAVDNGGGTCTLTYYVTGGGSLPPVAMGLLVTVDGGKTINDVTDIDPFFEIYIDYAYSVDPCYTYGDGHPIADPCAAGAIDLPQTKFVISMGGLGGETSPPTKFPKKGNKNNPVTLCVLHADTALGNTGVTTTGTISICPLRGGVIDEDAEVMDPNSEDSPGALALPFTITEDCKAFDDWDYSIWTSAPVGKPLCWCYKYNCKGDTDNIGTGFGDGKKWVVLADLQLLGNSLTKRQDDVTLPANYQCANFDRLGTGFGLGKKWVVLGDLQILGYGLTKRQDDPHFVDNPCPGW